MLFNSFEFLFAFLPLTFLGYFFLNHQRYCVAAKVWLLVASLFFYGWWNPKYVFLIVASIGINYTFHRILRSSRPLNIKKVYLILGVTFNVAVLGYYKYVDFFISNFNIAFGTDYNLFHIILPLGISFFTFQQIAFLVDTYKDLVEEMDLLNFSVFVSFFPQLIAGPIVHHAEMMPQFYDDSRKRINLFNISKGLLMFNMGLAKKVIIADTFGKVANMGYANSELLGFSESWLTSFAYTVQLYFDFSGYSDMALGLGLLFNIDLPVNFFSPYKSRNIQEFWRRWHITLSRFLRDYIYIPLGGNKKGELRTYYNTVITFLIGGLWHGANWTFVFWGALHGFGLVVLRIFGKVKMNPPGFISTIITFFFVLITWVFFRASDWQVAINVLKGMAGLTDGNIRLFSTFLDLPIWVVGIFLLFAPNTIQLGERFKPNQKFAFALVALVIVNVLFMNSSAEQDFLYFDF